MPLLLLPNPIKKSHDTVGKFGVGFKAVFQYTETPHIYDPNFQFKISKFIVPINWKGFRKSKKKMKLYFIFHLIKQTQMKMGY